MIKPLITGADGLLGRDITRILSGKHPQTIKATIDFLDISDYDRVAIEFERLLPTAVINCAATTDVDWCEDHPDEAFRVNVEGAFNIARACKHIAARLIHISTDYVFDGMRNLPYKEDDTPSPISVYGKTKLEGERAVFEENPESVVVRTSCLFGRGGRNFQSTVASRCAQGEMVRAFVDSFCSPTSTGDCARAIDVLLDIDFTGILHIVNSGICSRFQFAETALKMKEISGSYLIPVEMRSVGLKALRPRYSALDNSLFARITGLKMRRWDEALRDFLISNVE